MSIGIALGLHLGRNRAVAPPNLLRWSEAFDNAMWNKERATVTADALAAPNGTTTADRLIEAAVTGTHDLYQSYSLTAGDVVTFSCYLKAGERTVALLAISDGGLRTAWFDLAAGTVGTVQATLTTATIVAAGNGWYRCAITRAIANTASHPCVVGLATADNVSSYAGDSAKGLYIWGAQLVRGGSPGPYQQTQ